MIKLNFLKWYLPERKKQKQKKMMRLLGYHLAHALLLGCIYGWTQWNVNSETQKNQTMQNQINVWMQSAAKDRSPESTAYSFRSSLLACLDALDHIHHRTDGLYSFEIHPPKVVLKMTPVRSNLFFNAWMKPLLQQTCMEHLSSSVESENNRADSSLFIIQGTLKGAVHAD